MYYITCVTGVQECHIEISNQLGDERCSEESKSFRLVSTLLDIWLYML